MSGEHADIKEASERLDRRNKLWRGDRVTPKTLVQEYNAGAAHYDEDMDVIEWCGPIFTSNAVRKYVPDRYSRILDACAGSGRVGKELYDAGYMNLTYLDGSREMFRVCVEKNIYQNYLEMIIEENVPTLISSNYYDVTTMCGGHVSDAKIHELFRLTKTGGYVVITAIQFTGTSENRDYPSARALIDHLERNLSQCKVEKHIEIPQIHLDKDGRPIPGHVIVIKKLHDE